MYPSWKDFLQYFEIAPPSTESLYLLFFIIAFVVLLFVFGEVYMSRKRYLRRLARDRRFFFSMAEARDLSADEVRLLNYITNLYHPDEPVSLINSVITFDKAAEQFLRNYQSWDEEYDREETSALLAAIREKCFHKEFHALDEINDTREFPPGQTIRLTVQTPSTKKFLNVAVADNLREGIVLESSHFSEYEEQLKEGKKTEGYFWRSGDAGYQFDMTVMRHISIETIMFSHTNRFRRKQRRHYFRVSVKLKGICYIFTGTEQEEFSSSGKVAEMQEENAFNCVIVSLSGGGVSFICRESVENGSLMQLSFKLKNGVQLPVLLARAVREKELGRKRRVYVEFLNLTDSSRESIIHYVSQVQLSGKKKLAE